MQCFKYSPDYNAHRAARQSIAAQMRGRTLLGRHPYRLFLAACAITVSRSLWRRHDAQFLHHAQGVEFSPIFHDLAAGDAVDADTRHRHPLARRRNSHQLATVRAGRRPAADHLVTRGKNVLNCEISNDFDAASSAY